MGEQLGYRYEVEHFIDKGSFGHVIQCRDLKDPKRGSVAIKISKNKKFNVDNAKIELQLIKKLSNNKNDEMDDLHVALG